jgi:hypothetical protein
MFAPEGYSFFEEIVERIDSLVAEAYPFFGSTNVIGVVQRRQIGRRDALFEFSMKCRSLSVASPQGIVNRISPMILAMRDLGGIGHVFPFIDRLTGQVDTARTRQISQWASTELLSYRAEMDSSPSRQIELESEATELFKTESDRNLLKCFSLFDGWAIVCRTEHLPESVTFFETLNDSFKADRASSPSSREIVEALVALIDGGQRPLKEAFRAETCPNMKREEFRAIWAEAAGLRPELAKPGPK